MKFNVQRESGGTVIVHTHKQNGSGGVVAYRYFPHASGYMPMVQVLRNGANVGSMLAGFENFQEPTLNTCEVSVCKAICEQRDSIEAQLS